MFSFNILVFCFKQWSYSLHLYHSFESCFPSDPSAAGEQGQVGPVMKPSEGELLMLILEEVKVARQETGRHVKDDRKPGRYTRLALILDSVYFVLYVITVVSYTVYMNVEWLGSYLANKKE